MRTEEMEKEASLFDRESEGFIHVQRSNDGPFAVLITGDPVVIEQGVYNIMLHMEREYHVPFDAQLKILKKAHRKLGKKK